MSKNAKAGRNRTLAFQVAQLRVMDLPAGRRGPSYMDDRPRTRPNQDSGGSRLSRIIEFLDESIPLPRDLRSFLIYCSVLFVVVAGTMVHVLMSAQILQAEVEVANMENQYTVIKRQNGELLWRIGRATNLQQVQERAKAEGYAPIAERQYVGTGAGGGVLDARRPMARDQADDAPPEESPAPAAATPDTETALAADETSATLQAPGENVPATVDRRQRLRQWWTVLYPDAEGEDGPTPTPADEATATPSLQSSLPITVEEQSWQPIWMDNVVDSITVLITRTTGTGDSGN